MFSFHTTIGRTRHTSSVVCAIILAFTLATTACSSTDQDGSDSVMNGSSDAECPTEPITVLVTVSQWSAIVSDLAGGCASLITPVSGGAQDPHDFEPTPSDLFGFQSADVIVVNGLGYDEWANQAIDALNSKPTIIDISVLGDRSPGDNPHLWYDPEMIEVFADKMTTLFNQLLPDASTFLSDRRAEWDEPLTDYLQLIADISAGSDGTTFGATEPVYDEMALAAGLTDATPSGYRTAALNETEPSPADLSKFEGLLTDGTIDVLIYNTQSEGSTSAQIRSAAESAGVPVVEITESKPDDVVGFWDWQIAQLEALKAAIQK